MKRIFAVLLLSLAATGCATMVNGRHQTLSVDSFPSGASVEVDCGGERPRVAAAPTPVKVQVLRAAEVCQLTFTRAGYEPKTIELTHQESRVTRLNGAFGLPSAIVLGIAGAIVGSAVDGTETGAAIGAEAGYDLGHYGARALDMKGGGWKWIPARIFVVLSRTTPEDSVEPDSAEPE